MVHDDERPRVTGASLLCAEHETKLEAVTILKVFGLTPDVVDAEAFLASNQKLQAIDQMLGTAAGRRDGSMREIERSREAVTYLEPKKVIEAKVVQLSHANND